MGYLEVIREELGVKAIKNNNGRDFGWYLINKD
jgi:hypothetical protein